METQIGKLEDIVDPVR